MWDEIQDAPGEIFDVDLHHDAERVLEDIRAEKMAQKEEERFLDICNELMMEGIIDEDAIEEEAHRLMDEET